MNLDSIAIAVAFALPSRSCIDLAAPDSVPSLPISLTTAMIRLLHHRPLAIDKSWRELSPDPETETIKRLRLRLSDHAETMLKRHASSSSSICSAISPRMYHLAHPIDCLTAADYRNSLHTHARGYGGQHGSRAVPGCHAHTSCRPRFSPRRAMFRKGGNRVEGESRHTIAETSNLDRQQTSISARVGFGCVSCWLWPAFQPFDPITQ